MVRGPLTQGPPCALALFWKPQQNCSARKQKLQRKEQKLHCRKVARNCTATSCTAGKWQESGRKLHSNILHCRKAAENCNAAFSDFQRILRNCSAVFSETSDLWYSKLDTSSYTTTETVRGSQRGWKLPAQSAKINSIHFTIAIQCLENVFGGSPLLKSSQVSEEGRVEGSDRHG